MTEKEAQIEAMLNEEDGKTGLEQIIKTVSTDSMQEIMKKYFYKDKEPILHCPSYKCVSHIYQEKPEDQTVNIQGYKEQCKVV